MEKIRFQEHWIFSRCNDDTTFEVALPHDAMLSEKRSEANASGVNTGWFAGGDYRYEKNFYVPERYREMAVFLEFEGVYHNAEVYVNGDLAAVHDYGYTGFLVDLRPHLIYGCDNRIQVLVKNREQPNCRWYSGSGIYRPVWLYLLPNDHIRINGVKIATIDHKNPEVRVSVETSGRGKVRIEILDGNTVRYHGEEMETDGQCVQTIKLYGARLWSVESPYLYRCRVYYGKDMQETQFGIRTISCDSTNGFCINGKRVILRGACIHHDNGLLGACAYDYAEERKVRLLKQAGYNSIRSAHNPCSRAVLEACDKLGMLVADEYVDYWYIHKTKYDYADNVEKNYRRDLMDIVNKDYNHPSVILYSIGNEVAETAEERGIGLCESMTEYLHSLDGSRPVTCGINIFFNLLSSLGFGVYTDEKAEAEAGSGKKKAVGSEFFNNLAGIFGAEFMKWGATLHGCDVKTRKAFSKLDVAGYNYGILRYEKDLKKYPDRVILGSETFCSDAYKFWELAKRYPALIGDYVWSGMDYLGEVGLGAWEYEEYAPDFQHHAGWLTAGSGRIDLTGKPLAEMAYTRVAFELDKIHIAVVPVNSTNKAHSPSAWKMSNAVESWSWNGCEGMASKVEVYARAAKAELLINGKSMGMKKMKNGCRAVFRADYMPGEIRAVAYDEHDAVIAETALQSAGDETVLTLVPEETVIRAHDDLCYIRMMYTDKMGVLKPLARADIQVSVTGGTLLGLGSACPYNPKGFLTNTTDTYYGEALAIIRPDGKGNITVCAMSAYGDSSTTVMVQEC